MDGLTMREQVLVRAEEHQKQEMFDMMGALTQIRELVSDLLVEGHPGVAEQIDKIAAEALDD